MRDRNRAKRHGWIASRALLAVSVIALSGCATESAYVQPGTAGSGGYYTSSEPYSGQGYYDLYGTGPYYPGTSGWGYYNGTAPRADPFGWYGYYGVGYWPTFVFNIGVSGVWDFPGYWGPWYATGFPIWACDGPGCGRWRHRRHHHHGHSASNNTPLAWLKPDHPPIPRLARGPNAPPPAIPARPLEASAHRRPYIAAFAPQGFVHAPVRLQEPQHWGATPALPIMATRLSTDPMFNSRSTRAVSFTPTAPQHFAGMSPVRSHANFQSAPPLRISTPPPPARVSTSRSERH